MLLKFFGGDFHRDSILFIVSACSLSGVFFSICGLLTQLLFKLGLRSTKVHFLWNFIVFLSLYFFVEYICQVKLQIGLAFKTQNSLSKFSHPLYYFFR